MKTPKLDGWYAKKSFPHFDLPMDFSSAHKIVRDQNLVSQHSYRPFLGFTERKKAF